MKENIKTIEKGEDSHYRQLRPWQHCRRCPRYGTGKCPLDEVPDEERPRVMAYAEFIFRVRRARALLSDPRLFYVTWKHILFKSVPEDGLEECLKFIAEGVPGKNKHVK